MVGTITPKINTNLLLVVQNLVVIFFNKNQPTDIKVMTQNQESLDTDTDNDRARPLYDPKYFGICIMITNGLYRLWS